MNVRETTLVQFNMEISRWFKGQDKSCVTLLTLFSMVVSIYNTSLIKHEVRETWESMSRGCGLKRHIIKMLVLLS